MRTLLEIDNQIQEVLDSIARLYAQIQLFADSMKYLTHYSKNSPNLCRWRDELSILENTKDAMTGMYIRT